MVDKISNSDLDRILNGMNENRYTFGHICALIVKLAKIKTNAEMEEFINQMNTAIYTFNDIQVFWAPDICKNIFCIKNNLQIFFRYTSFSKFNG